MRHACQKVPHVMQYKLLFSCQRSSAHSILSLSVFSCRQDSTQSPALGQEMPNMKAVLALLMYRPCSSGAKQSGLCSISSNWCPMLARRR